MTSDTLLFDLTDKVAVITLNRPAVRNALNRELSQALMEALHGCVQTRTSGSQSSPALAGRSVPALTSKSVRSPVGLPMPP